MEEKRKAERLKDCNEINISVISDDKNQPKEKNQTNYSEDISLSGTKIRLHTLLSVDTTLKIDFFVSTLQQKITTFGKVKWIQSNVEDQGYEAGVEFVDTPGESIRQIYNYISWKQKRISLYPENVTF